jgi:hypothetical protein
MEVMAVRVAAAARAQAVVAVVPGCLPRETVAAAVTVVRAAVAVTAELVVVGPATAS